MIEPMSVVSPCLSIAKGRNGNITALCTLIEGAKKVSQIRP